MLPFERSWERRTDPPRLSARRSTGCHLPDSKHKLAIVIPTIQRYDELRKMLESLAAQTRLPEQVIIIDQDGTSQRFAEEFSQLAIRVIGLPGSACVKRNAGIRAAQPDVDLIAFIDDDIVLKPGAIEAVMAFWDSAPGGVGGVCLNVLNDTRRSVSRLKGTRVASLLGLYSSRRGAVLRSGFHVPFGQVSALTFVDWLPTYCVVYRRDVFERHTFDEFFRGYSYLEDLDLSYAIGKEYRLVVLPHATFYHYPSKAGRPNPFLFGKKEVVNRIYFVNKHGEFSHILCWVSLSIRMLMTALGGLRSSPSSNFKRLAGNLAGAFVCVTRGPRPV